MRDENFCDGVREALNRRGMSIRAAAKALSYDHAYLSRVLSGKQAPSPQLIDSLDALLGVSEPQPPAPAAELDSTAYVRSAVAHLLEHDNRHGGAHVADAAVQVWRAEQRKLDQLVDPDKSYLAAVSEIAQVAGWILFDAHRTDEARQAFIESQMLARHAGDRSRTWFALDMLAMQAVQSGRAGEALRIADELLSLPRIPPRVALIARVRRARALAQAGDRSRSLAEMTGAQSALQDSVGGRDPGWTWWVNDAEVAGHQGEMLMSLGDHASAVPHLQRARSLVRPGGRGALYYSVAELTALTSVGAWRDCDALLTDMAPLLDRVASTRSRSRLTETLRFIDRDAPPWLASTAREVAATC
ncbi:helix-turn-helix domain-containing protein [Streptomyces sp. NPDC091387]|uniref:helix-turn-helix domain-containing protein n=1 Tax=Streptomyces sp. NPDC091387 TaxID=3365998 RepID=UPI003830ECDE